MKQRRSLGLALCMDVPWVIIDEPTFFLDKQKKEWFRSMLEQYGNGKTIVMASNDEFDIEGCGQRVRLG